MSIRDQFSNGRCLVVYMDNGPKNSRTGTGSLERVIDFAEWWGLGIHFFGIPSHGSKYDSFDRCCSMERRFTDMPGDHFCLRIADKTAGQPATYAEFRK